MAMEKALKFPQRQVLQFCLPDKKCSVLFAWTFFLLFYEHLTKHSVGA